MKIGDYVRTEYGIAKCIKATPIKENSFLYEFDREVYEDVFHLTASELEKYKSSPNIIDLIEVGDYVNGLRVNEISEHTIYLDDMRDFSKKDINYVETIVTKEKFERMEYRIGEE